MAIAFSSMPPSAAAAAVGVGAREAAILQGFGRGFAEILREKRGAGRVPSQMRQFRIRFRRGLRKRCFEKNIYWVVIIVPHDLVGLKNI
jgi:hypothetical protein